MTEITDGICPLCSEVFPRESLREPIESEAAQMRERTVRVIQSYHRGWLEEHGACAACWKCYREAGQVVRILKTTRPQRVAGQQETIS